MDLVDLERAIALSLEDQEVTEDRDEGEEVKEDEEDKEELLRMAIVIAIAAIAMSLLIEAR